MTKVCPNCKTINSDSAVFCQNCGEEFKDFVRVPKNDKASSGGLNEWWDKRSSGGKAAVGLVGVCCLGLIFILIIGGIVFPDNNQNTTSIKTFQGNGVSFNYPNTWGIRPPSQDRPENVVYLNRTQPSIALLSVTKGNANGMSLNDLISKENNIEISEGNEIVSKKTVTVDGSQGYQITSKIISRYGDEAIQQKTVFIKNDTEYLIMLIAGSISDAQSDVNTILDSFKVI